ncbi:hypothetical protein EMIT0P44_60050 [Pseudomonas sp. IT-P44]
MGGCWADLLPGTGDHRQRHSTGDAGVLAGGRFVGSVSGGGDQRGAAVVPCAFAGWRRTVPGAGGAGGLVGRALQRPTGDLGRALAVPVACAARAGDCADAGVFRPALCAGAVPNVGVAADRLCAAVFTIGTGTDSHGTEQGCSAAGRGGSHAGRLVVQRVLSGDVADHLPGAGRGVCAGVSGCDEGADGDAATESDRAQYAGDRGLGAYRECGVCGGGALCGVVDIGVGVARVPVNNPDVFEPLKSFAGKPRSYKDCATPVGARLAREGVRPANTNLKP